MPNVKDFATKDLTPSSESPPLTPEMDESFFQMEGNVRLKFGFSLTSPVRKFRRWLARALQ